MPFEKVETQQVDFPALERAILEFWQRNETFDKLRAKIRNGPRWSFLDGPITANNPMGVHHAWGRTYKDAFQRYHAMNGRHQRFQNGFDCQGLWVEVEVEKELKLRSKRDIENLVPGDTFASVDRFVQQCKERVDKYARIQTEQSIRLGFWMDWDRDEDWKKPVDERRSYFTMSEENNYTIWSFLKKCHSRGLVYRGFDAMPWCPRCSVGLSQMEMSEGYRLVAHRAVFVRFPLRDRANENLLVWTTTPWTLTSNVAAAVNPALTYLKVRHKEQIYYLAKGAFTAQRLEDQWKRKEWVEGVPKLSTLEQHFKSKGGSEIVGEVRGADMIGWTYDGPFDELPAASGGASAPRKQHRVIAWKDVGETEGTGIVHIAPGCGKEDFQLGKEEKLPTIAPLDEFGVYLPGFGPLEGKSAVDPATTDWILDNLQHKSLLLAVEKYPHSYPHCWRCKTELLFRLVEEWFVDMKWRDEIKHVVEQVTFLPESVNGKAREMDWLTNMGDWMISKKRFWGLALPIWVDEQTGDFEIIGSRDELKQRAVVGWDKFEGHSPHRPWIDLVKIENPKTGNRMSRIADVGNPWLDAGIVPLSTMGYNRDRTEWEKWFPADFITESFPGQFRNWFYAILAMSTMMEQRPPTKTLLGYALMRDQWDRPMHKSAGNSIPFEGAADEGYNLTDPKGKTAHYPPMGADLIRWMFCRHNPANNLDFGPLAADELRGKFTLKLWNVYGFFCNYARLDGFDPSAPSIPLSERPDLDRWILSDLQNLIASARTAFESYNLMAFCLEAERFVDDKLSNWYVRRSRRRFWKSEQGTDKQAAYQTLYAVLVTLAKLFAPIVPFLSESIYRNLRTSDQPESVHLCDFPDLDKTQQDAELSEAMNRLLSLVSLGLAARNNVKIKVRQPLAEFKVAAGADSEERAAVERFGDQLREELNVKSVTLHDPEWGPLLIPEIKGNAKTLGPKFGPRLKEVMAALAAADPTYVAAKVRAGEPFELACVGETVQLEPADLVVQFKAPEGWIGLADRETQVALDTRITEELSREGMARDVVRHVQEQRKEAALQMEDRIALYLGTESEKLRQAIDANRDYIAAETLTVDWSAQSLSGTGVHRASAKVEGQTLTIELQRATAQSYIHTHSTVLPQTRKEATMEQPPQAALRLEILDGDIALLTLDQPGSRANTLGQALLGEWEAMMAQLKTRNDLRGLIIRSGKPGMFIAGADLRELGSIPQDADTVRRMVQRGLNLVADIEALPYPTAAAIEGACMGGGLELALGFDYRLASTHPKTEIGLPETKIGLIPGWGGTQRLSRLIGPSLAAEMICAGEAAKAERARQINLVFDAVPSERLQDEAVRLIEDANKTNDWKDARKRKQQPVGLSEEQQSFAFAVARAQVMAKTGGQYPAPLAALEAIAKGCNLPLSDGLKMETEEFIKLAGSPISRNLIAVFFMTQRLQKDPGISSAGVEPRPVHQVGVLGAGIMGAGIAGAHARRGIPALLLDNVPQALEKGVGVITKSMQGRVEIGRMTPADMAGALARLSTSMTFNALADRDVVIEAIIENEEAKVRTYRDVQKVLRPDAILASNTSTISITRMAKSVAHPESFAGLHFFNPVDRMQLVEVIRGEQTSDATVVTLVALAKRIGKTPIVVRDCPGFLVNRILFPYLNEALVLLQEGASPRALDKAATAFGMPMGPITLSDVVGLDTSLYAGRVINTAFADRAAPTRILDELVAAGRLGQKSGSGFYSYAKGSRGMDDPAFEAYLAKCRTGQRQISNEEITDRLFLPMLTEASRVLTEGIVREPGDVDMGLILGIGFPPFRGGILRWADSLGLAKVVDKLKTYEKLGTRFQPTEQMRKLAAAGKGFYPA